MRAQVAIDRKPVLKTTSAKRQNKAEKKPIPFSYLQRIARRLKVLRQLNPIDSRTRFLGKDEVVRAWTVSYFLPMLKCRASLRPERKSSVEDDARLEPIPEGRTGVRLVAKPRKGLRLPCIFAPCKRFETPRTIP